MVKYNIKTEILKLNPEQSFLKRYQNTILINTITFEKFLSEISDPIKMLAWKNYLTLRTRQIYVEPSKIFGNSTQNLIHFS